jgi:acyl carrier protein
MGSDHDAVSEFVRTRFRTRIRGELRPDNSLFSSGVVDSFGVLELIAFLEDTFHVSIDPARHELAEFDTINKIIELVGRIRSSA